MDPVAPNTSPLSPASRFEGRCLTWTDISTPAELSRRRRFVRPQRSRSPSAGPDAVRPDASPPSATSGVVARRPQGNYRALPHHYNPPRHLHPARGFQDSRFPGRQRDPRHTDRFSAFFPSPRFDSPFHVKHPSLLHHWLSFPWSPVVARVRHFHLANPAKDRDRERLSKPSTRRPRDSRFARASHAPHTQPRA